MVRTFDRTKQNSLEGRAGPKSTGSRKTPARLGGKVAVGRTPGFGTRDRTSETMSNMVNPFRLRNLRGSFHGIVKGRGNAG